MATKIKCSWTYNDAGNGWCGLPQNSTTGYNALYNDIMQSNFDFFAGDAEKGVYSPSVQQTIYQIGQDVIKK